MPDAMLPARPSARVVVSASMPRRRQAATVAPKTPQTPVGWKPRRWKPSGAAMPMRVTVSVAATIAARVCAPVAPTASAAAIAAGTTTVATWAIDASCVSSKSRPWHSMPLASAAAAAGTRSARPIALEGPDPASSATASPGRASPTPSAASPQPSASRMCSRATARTSAGTSASWTDDVQAASSCAAARCSVSIVMS